ncbi:MAG: hypothetical protein ACP5E5_02580 [Acidobacteriaceae bacterium]
MCPREDERPHDAVTRVKQHSLHHPTDRGAGREQLWPILRTSEWKKAANVMKFLLFVILLVLCWPAALLVLILYPIVWLVLLPFRLIGVVVGGVLELIAALFTLPARALRSL